MGIGKQRRSEKNRTRQIPCTFRESVYQKLYSEEIRLQTTPTYTRIEVLSSNNTVLYSDLISSTIPSNIKIYASDEILA